MFGVVVLLRLLQCAQAVSTDLPASTSWMPPALNNMTADHNGCFPSYASSQLKVIAARPMSVDVANFSATFAHDFSFEHGPENWLSMSGSGVWLEQQRAYVTSARMIRSPKGFGDPRVWLLQSHIYLQAWDEAFNPIALRYRHDADSVVDIPQRGRVLDIPNLTPHLALSGPEDARMHIDNYGHLFLTFNMHDGEARRHWSYNLTSAKLVHLKPTLGRDQNQKNWVPFIFDDQLHFVHKYGPKFYQEAKAFLTTVLLGSFYPLRIARCDPGSGACDFVVGQGTTGVASLRGGTPFRQYRNTPYYVGFARTTQLCDAPCHRIYRPNFVVLRLPPGNSSTVTSSYDEADVVYTSEPLDLNLIPLHPPFLAPNEPKHCMSLMLPYGFLRWDMATPDNPIDEAYVQISVQDKAIVLLKIRGVEQLVVDVIDATERRLQELRRRNIVWPSPGPSQIRCAEDRMKAYCPAVQQRLPAAERR
ncbi:Beta-mannosyltransferase 1 [Sorochytrium milnesiophthora]